LVTTADENRIMFISFDDIGAIPELGILDGDAYVYVGDRSADDIATLILDRSGQQRPLKTASRVCFISSEYPPNVLGGLGVHVKHLTMALNEHLEIDVVLGTLESNEYQALGPRIHLQPLANNHPTYLNPISWFYFADQAADKIIRLARTNPPDLIHCHDWVTVLAGMKCRWLLKVPLIFHLHLPNLHQLCSAVESLGLICADLVTVNSEYMYEELGRRQFENKDLAIRKVETVMNGVDTNEFLPAPDWPDKYILFVGRLVGQKGVEYLVRAFYYIKEKFPDIRLKIVGIGQSSDALKALTVNLLLSDKVDFLGWKTGPDLVSLYQKAQVVVVPSIYEPFGMTALEALACQRPVVASRVGGLQEIIQHEVTGFLARPKDELDLAQWIMTLLSSDTLRHSMGKAGRERVLAAGYTWPEIAVKFLQLYADVLDKPISLELPDRAEEIQKMIEKVAKKMFPTISDNLVRELFEWKS